MSKWGNFEALFDDRIANKVASFNVIDFGDKFSLLPKVII